MAASLPPPQPVTYGLALPARTLRAVPAQDGTSAWVVGTTALREENEVRLLAYDSNQEQLLVRGAWPHAAEVWDVAWLPGCEDKLVTVHCKAGEYGATLWRASDGSQPLEQLARLPHQGTMRRAAWLPAAPQRLLTLTEGALMVWDAADGGLQTVRSGAAGELEQLWAAEPHPHDARLAAVAAGASVQLWDVEDMHQAAAVEQPGGVRVLGMSWAPSNQHRLATAGDDGALRFYDTRALSRREPLLTLQGHTHWAWAASYSPFHDCLLLSSSTDCSVALWHLAALARIKDAPAGSSCSGTEQQQQQQQSGARVARPGRPDAADGKAATFDDHEESVYGLAWSAADPWLFASLSYDGRLVLNRVPKALQYRILI